MIEVEEGVKILNLNTIGLPYTIRLYGVTDEMFDEVVDEDLKAELIDGVLIMHSPASMWHEDIASFLGSLMRLFVDAKGLGKFIARGHAIIRLATGRRLSPDGFFIRQARVPSPLPKEFEGAPDLVVEVLSPSNRKDDLEDKRLVYQEAGVPEIWFIDGEDKQLIIDRKHGGGYVEEVITNGRAYSTVLGGFWIDVAWLWAEPLPNGMTCLQEILSGGQTK